MNTLVFPTYGVSWSGPNEVHVVAEHIETYWAIDYNGNAGTEIQLTSGKTLRVGCWPGEVTQKLKAVQA